MPIIVKKGKDTEDGEENECQVLLFCAWMDKGYRNSGEGGVGVLQLGRKHGTSPVIHFTKPSYLYTVFWPSTLVKTVEFPF